MTSIISKSDLQFSDCSCYRWTLIYIFYSKRSSAIIRNKGVQLSQPYSILQTQHLLSDTYDRFNNNSPTTNFYNVILICHWMSPFNMVDTLWQYGTPTHPHAYLSCLLLTYRAPTNSSHSGILLQRWTASNGPKSNVKHSILFLLNWQTLETEKLMNGTKFGKCAGGRN